MNIRFCFNHQGAKQGFPWMIAIDDVEHWASKVVFEKVTCETEILRPDDIHVLGWVTIEGVVEWKENKVAVIRNE